MLGIWFWNVLIGGCKPRALRPHINTIKHIYRFTNWTLLKLYDLIPFTLRFNSVYFTYILRLQMSMWDRGHRVLETHADLSEDRVWPVSMSDSGVELVRESAPLSLYCQSDLPWFLCVWTSPWAPQHTRSSHCAPGWHTACHPTVRVSTLCLQHSVTSVSHAYM